MLVVAVATVAAALAAFASFVFGAAQPQPGQRIDMKVLLIGDSGTEPTFEAWKYQLSREGVPFEAVRAGVATDPEITDAKLADYAQKHAYYQGVILSVGNMASLTAAERAALTKFETTFGVRQLSDNTFPSLNVGLSAPTFGGNQPATAVPEVANLTAAGKLAFPYLKGSVEIDNSAWRYRATPLSPASFETLLAGPANSSYLGVYTDPLNGREEMVSTIDSNQWQVHNQLLRHGMLNWVTRGVYLGHQRNYLDMHIDDVFIGDDRWDTTANTTSFTNVIRMNAADVDKAVQWAQANGLRLDMVYNGANTDPGLLDAFKANVNFSKFGWINHTLEHPNLDCSTTNFIKNQINANITFANNNGLPIDRADLVTGEHSGLENSRPGNPGTIDPPSMRDVQPATGGTLPAGDYDYAVTAGTPNGETTLSDPESEAATGAVQVNWDAVCHATTYNIYRKLATETTWSKVGTANQPATAFTDAGPATVSFIDTGANAPGGAPPASNTAVVSPYVQNVNLAPALNDTGIRYTGTDASKAYGTAAAGSSFTVTGTNTRAVPRWPTNVYYNVATQTEQLDEYNWLYLPPPNGACVDIPNVTTCRTAAATWDEYVANEKQIMFRHLMGNDPRPHFFHESNIAETSNAEGGILYKVVDALLADYRKYFEANAPLVQPDMTQIGDELARQDKWAQDASGVTGYLLDGKVHVRNNTAAAANVPLTGVAGVGSAYGGQQSGWTQVQPGQEVVFPPDPPVAKPPVTTAPKKPGKPGSKPPVGATSALRIQSLGVAPRKFAVARGKAGGTRISWRLSQAATLRLSFERSVVGRRSRGSCRPATRANSRRPKCRRYVGVGTLKVAARGGRGSVRFTGKLGRRTLRVGGYRVVAVATAGKRASAPRTAAFSVRASKRGRR